MNDKTKSAPKEAEITIYKCHNCKFEYYEKANYCTRCGHKQLEGGENMIEQKKETAFMADIKNEIEQGKMSLNEARIQVGLKPIDDPVANVLVKKV